MVMAALAVVLGAMSVVLRVLRRYAVTNASSRKQLKMEVIQRLSLGQRQGVAVVRIGARVMVVSMGDGGVHQIAELTENDIAPATDSLKSAGGPSMHSIADGIRKLVLVRGGADTKTATTARGVKGDAKRISYVAPMEDFQAVLSMAMAGGARS
jgi:flagellar biogenesis protein FliO